MRTLARRVEARKFLMVIPSAGERFHLSPPVLGAVWQGRPVVIWASAGLVVVTTGYLTQVSAAEWPKFYEVDFEGLTY